MNRTRDVAQVRRRLLSDVGGYACYGLSGAYFGVAAICLGHLLHGHFDWQLPVAWIVAPLPPFVRRGLMA